MALYVYKQSNKHFLPRRSDVVEPANDALNRITN